MYSLDHYPLQDREKINPLTRFLWWAAGADSFILSRCTYSDHVKFTGLGGIVLATGVLASVSGAYAFYTIFSPKELQGAAEAALHVPSVLLSVFFGGLWGLIIFNLDRFLISSTGKGDGTEAITFSEFYNAIPRTIMALVLSIAIAAPLEIRIFKTEIDAALFQLQKEKIQELNRLTNERFAEQIADSTADRDKLEKQINDKQAQLDGMRVKLQEEIAGRVGSGQSGVGPAARQIRADVERLAAELRKLETRNSSTLLNANKDIDALKSARDEEYATNAVQAKKLDGLLQRILLAEEIAGAAIIWLIRGLFIVIETGPIFFKLMIIKSPYDFIDEGLKEEIKARAGIVAYEKIDVNGRRVTEYKSLSMERIAEEQRKLQEAQRELAAEILETWKQGQLEEVKKDPSKFVKA
ncbi:MAG: DUF4407 domain-containing protein [Myxococcota bacterium]